MEIVVIGDNPTAVEFRNKVCMTGPAVSILQQSMTQVGLPISKDKVYYTTALKVVVPKKKGYVVPKELMIAQRPGLIAEINSKSPKIVIVLGKIAFQTLAGNYNVKITEEQGRPRSYDFIPGATVIPVLHPALIMRAPKDYKPFFTSIQLIGQIYNGGGVHDTGETKWNVLNTEEECDEALAFLSTKKRITGDIETTGLDYRSVEFCVMGMCFEKNKVFVIPRHMRHRCIDFFNLKDVKWTWHHGKYDRKVMWRRNLLLFDSLGWHEFPHQNDTMYMHYVLDETSAHDLGNLTKTYLQAAEYKFKMNQQFKAVSLETYDHFFESLCERVAVDCDYGFQLEDVLWEEICRPENKSLKVIYQDLIMPATGFLARVEQNGMLVDEDILNDMKIKYDEILEGILHSIGVLASPYWDRELYMKEAAAKSAPLVFNPGSSKQMQWMVFKRLKLKPKYRAGTSTNADVLESIEEDIPLIKKVLEYRSVKKEQSTYVIGTLNKRDADGRVRSNFSLHITATGRLSSKEPNVQNVPSANGVGNVRRAYIPPKGKIIMEVDYSGAELRWLAYLSRCPVLMDVFVSNRNLHHETATALFGENYTLQQKMRAKAVNFGIPYGRQAKSFADEFNISMEEAQAMIDGWLNKYYGARDYLNWCANQINEGNYLQTPWGNRRRFGLVTKESLDGLQNEAKNFPIQCSSSHLLLFCCIQMEQTLKIKYDTNICDLIHDSLYMEVPNDPVIIKAVSEYVSGYMIQAPIDLFKCDVPFKTDTDVGPDWGNLKPYNHKTEMMEIEGKDHKVTKVPFVDWIKAEYHDDIYERPWYKELKNLRAS
jgi:DNA polymerase-1